MSSQMALPLFEYKKEWECILRIPPHACMYAQNNLL